MLPISVILNPASGGGKGRQLRPALEAALRHVGLDFVLYETTAPTHATELARTAKERGFTVVVAVGGDGTINEVINGLAQADAQHETIGPLAVIPVGTGNDFAAALGMEPITRWGKEGEARLHRLAKALITRNIRTVDLGYGVVRDAKQTTSRYFDNSLAAGLEAYGAFYSKKLTALPSALVYPIAAVQAILTYRAPQATVCWHNSPGEPKQVEMPLLMASIGNTHRTGGGFLITPAAQADDGCFDMALIRSIPRPQLLRLLPKARIGKHTTHPAVTMSHLTHLTIDAPAGIPVHMDGELISEFATKIEVKILPGKLQLIPEQD